MKKNGHTMKKITLTIIVAFVLTHFAIAHDLPEQLPSEPLPPTPSIEPVVKVFKSIDGKWHQIDWHTNVPITPRERMARADKIAGDLQISGGYKVVVNFPTGFNHSGVTGWRTKRYLFPSYAIVKEFIDNF